MLRVLFLKETSLLKSWIGQFLDLEEASKDLADVADVVAIQLPVKLELVLEKAMLALEDGNIHHDRGKCLQRCPNVALVRLVKLSFAAIVLHNLP